MCALEQLTQTLLLGDVVARADPEREGSITCRSGGACPIDAPDKSSTAGATNLKRVGGVVKAATPPCSRNRQRRTLHRQPQQLPSFVLCCGELWHLWNALRRHKNTSFL
jgi:hypothetical protein